MYMQAKVPGYCSYTYQPPPCVPEIIPNPDRPAVPTRCKCKCACAWKNKREWDMGTYLRVFLGL
jgi:hypothetical protein